MRDDVRRDFGWQQRFVKEIKGILAEHLIAEAPPEEDMRRNTDFIVIGVTAKRVACRVRRFEHLARYGGEFTIRSRRESGAETELDKLIAGWGDYIFYGFATEDETALATWTLGNLSVFRVWLNYQLLNGRRPWVAKTNGDGRSSFVSFRIADLPADFVKASSGQRLRVVSA